MPIGSDQVRVLYLADLVGRGLDARFTQLALNLANFVDVCLGTWGGEAEAGVLAEVARSGRKVWTFRFPFERSGRPIRCIREFAGALDAERIEVVHCQCYRHVVLCRLASALSHSKPAIVFTDHNPLAWRGMEAVPRLALLAAIRPRVIDLSNHLSRIPILRRKAAWIPNGVDTAFFRPPDRRSLSGVPTLIYPARLEPIQKRHSEFLKLCSGLRQKGHQFRLVLAGDGPARKNLEDLAGELGLQDVVRFAGHLNRDQLLMELLTADIGVFPSHAEMLPYAVLEMMATALPVVAYAAGGIPLIIRHGDTGFLAPIGAEGEFERHLIRLLNNPGLAHEIGCRAASDVRARFDIAVVARRLAELYRACAPGKPALRAHIPIRSPMAESSKHAGPSS
jgi:glycosyltransferase involved in cell wall biosynthesis